MATRSSPEAARGSVAVPRRLAEPAPLRDPTLANLRYQSPLRYPGAKGWLSEFIAEAIRAATPALGRPSLFVEPFAGGAAVSLRLAGEGTVDRVLIGDADPLVAQFWRTAAADTSWLVDRMWDEPVTLDRWDYWRAYRPSATDDRNVAMKCLFLNRTTFSGILHGGAGPIGGRAQSGEYKIDCRFNKTDIQMRLEYVGDLYEANRLVDVWCKDWEETLGDVAEWYPQLLPDKVVAYVDPPYIDKSAKLYGLSFDPGGGHASTTRAIDLPAWRGWREHVRLATYLRRRARYRWLLSYDDHDDLLTDHHLYDARQMTPTDEDRLALGIRSWRISRRRLSPRYTAAGSSGPRSTTELLLTTLPPATVPISRTAEVI